MKSSTSRLRKAMPLFVGFLLIAPWAWADSFPGDVGPGDPWKQPPYDFVFDNHVDTHAQLRLHLDHGDPKSLKGSLYIYFTGEIDHASGLPIARHPRGPAQNEECGVDPIECVAAWRIKGRPGAAKFLYHAGVNGNDHATWMVNRAEELSAPGYGMVIPQPGAFSHFHWLSGDASDPRAVDVSAACDKTSAGDLETTEPTAANEICEGWFLQLNATIDFAFQHGGEIIPIYHGMDLRSHLNIVTNYSATPAAEITATRESGGSH